MEKKIEIKTEGELKELVKKLIMTSSLSLCVPNFALNHIFHWLETGKRFQ